MLAVIPNHFLLYRMSQGFLLSPENDHLARLTSQLALGIPCLSLLMLGLQADIISAWLLMHARYLSSELQCSYLHDKNFIH